MIRIIEGVFKCDDFKIGIVVSRFNSLVTDRLLDGAIDALKRSGLSEENITIVKTPGAFEIPAVAGKMVDSEKYSGIVCLGAVIRGETPHFDYVSAEATKGIASVSMNAKIPVIFGVLTTESLDQALNRAGAKSGNKGYEAAKSCIEMINLYKEL
jgi:6,7-dimethyl-8-ribityllumazine synthase